MIYFIFVIIIFILKLLLKLKLVTTAVIGIFLLISLQLHKRLYIQMLRQNARFRDTSVYMDTLLYAFLKEGKILRAFEDVLATIRQGELKKLVEEAMAHMLLAYDDSEGLSHSLEIIEEKYNCKRIRNIHNFMMNVEYYGGDIEQSIELLLEDKNRWERRIISAREERRQLFVQIVMSVVASLVICGVVLYLPVMNVDISGNNLVQIFSVVVIVLDDMIIMRGQKMLCQDWLILDMLDEDLYYERKMREYKEYNPQKDKLLSAGLSIIPLLLCGYWIIMGRWWWLAGSLVILAICINQHRIGRRLACKNISKYIKSAFPVWLMDMGLLLQSENVHMALKKSLLQVSGVMRADLERLIDEIEINPESSEPYYSFLEEFDVPEVHSTVGMLYSISQGSSANTQQQIKELLVRNQELLDVADRERLHNKNSVLYLLFLAPVLTASLKLVIDMGIFMLSFLTVKVV